MATIMGYWDCSYCDKKRILGTEQECPGCGNQRDKDTRFYMSGEDILLEDISEPHRPVSIETARNDRAVGEYREMIAKSVAEHRLAKLLALRIGPLKTLAELDVELVLYPRAALAEVLESAEFLAQKPHNVAVKVLDRRVTKTVLRQIPESENHKNSLAARSICKIEAGLDIGFSSALALSLKAM